MTNSIENSIENCIQTEFVLLHLVSSKFITCYINGMRFGEMAEWSKAAVLKTVEGNPLPGFESLSLRHCPRESVLPIRLLPDSLVLFEGCAYWAEHWQPRKKAGKRSLSADILQTS